MKEFLKKHFPGAIRFVRDTQQLNGYRKKKKAVRERNEKLHSVYEKNL